MYKVTEKKTQLLVQDFNIFSQVKRLFWLSLSLTTMNEWINEWVTRFVGLVFGVDWWEKHSPVPVVIHKNDSPKWLLITSPSRRHMWFPCHGLVPWPSWQLRASHQKFRAHSHPPFSLNVVPQLHIFCKLRFQLRKQKLLWASSKKCSHLKTYKCCTGKTNACISNLNKPN